MATHLRLIAAVALVAAVTAPFSDVGAAAGWRAAATIPPGCVEHTSFDGGADAPGDVRCAGLAISLHHAGPQSSPHPLWAGQWLFVDDAGGHRVGWCTFQQGVHPTTLGRAAVVQQEFPLDPTGRKRAYLTWRYGSTDDDALAAAVWAVVHHYAQDAAGSSRSADPDAPLVGDLAQLAEMTGSQQLEDDAIELDLEANRFSGEPRIVATSAADGTVTVSVLAGDVPLPNVSVLVTSAHGVVHRGVTGGEGTVHVAVEPEPDGDVVTVSAAVPAQARVYAGPPAAPDQHGVQTLLTAGVQPLQTVVTRLPATTTTAPAPTTTTQPPPTTTPPTTPTIATTTTLPTPTTRTIATTTTTLPTTPPPTTTTTTTTMPTTQTTQPPPTTEPPTTTNQPISTAPPPDTTVPAETTGPAEVSPPTLPRTGGGSDAPALIGTALVVGGLGLLGAIGRRRERPDGVSGPSTR